MGSFHKIINGIFLASTLIFGPLWAESTTALNAKKLQTLLGVPIVNSLPASIEPTLCAHLHYYFDFVSRIHYSTDQNKFQTALELAISDVANAKGVNLEPALLKGTQCEAIEKLSQDADPKEKIRIYENILDLFLRGLDPHSYFVTDEDYQAFFEERRGMKNGFGFLFTEHAWDHWISPEYWKIKYILNDSPAYGRLEVGDSISHINGVSLYKYTRSGVQNILNSKDNVKLQLDPFKIVYLNKAPIQEPSVFYKTFTTISGEIAYLDVRRFDEATTANEISAVLQGKDKTMKGLLIDLRGNPGGDVSSVTKILSMFLGRQKKAVMLRMNESAQLVMNKKYSETNVGSKKMRTIYINTKGHRSVPKVPIIILVDYASASGAEMLSGVLQDYGALVLGQNTLGKGTGQISMPTSPVPGFEGFKGNIVVTLLAYFLPKGERVQEDGVTPDIILPDRYLTHLLEVQPQYNLQVYEKHFPYVLRVEKNLEQKPLSVPVLLKGKELLLKKPAHEWLKEFQTNCSATIEDCVLKLALKIFG